MSHRTLGLGFLTSLALLPLSSVPAPAQTVPTKVLVRAVSHDAKVIGSNVGGAQVTIRDAATGAVLAQGVQKGGTGSTERIVIRPRERGAAVFDTPGTAGFLAILHLSEPRLVEIAAEAPLAYPHAMQRVSKTLLLVPGRDVLGEGVVLELYGFTVEILEPHGNAPVAAGKILPVRARVTMLCGCPTEPGGLWDSNRFTVLAQLIQNGALVREVPLRFAGETSTYAGDLPLQGGGPFLLRVLAIDAERANFGLAVRELEASE